MPVPAAVLERMAGLMRDRDWTGLVFTAPDGGQVHYSNFRTRVWYPAVASARLCGRPADESGGKCAPDGCADPAHRIRAYPPRVMRHTPACWLVHDGVPLYDVQALLGHESFATTQSYGHLQPDAHSKVLASWKRRAATGGGTR